MPANEKFRFYLKDSFGSYYTVGAAGVVSFSLAKVPLPEAPKGWDATEIRRRRSLTYMGMLTEMTTPYEFVLDGATILRSLFYASGIDAECTLIIEKQNATDWLYYPYYIGEIDFEQFSDAGDFVKVEVVQGGVNALVERNAKKTYEIPLVYNEATMIHMDGMSLRNRSIVQFYLNPPVTAHQVTPQVRTIKNESPIGVSVLERTAVYINDLNNQYANGFFFKATIEGKVKIEYDFKVFYQDSGSSTWNPAAQDFRVFVGRPDAAASSFGSVELYKTNGNGVAPATYLGLHSFAGSVEFDVANSERLCLVMVAGQTVNGGSGAGALNVNYTIQLAQMTVSYNARPAGSDCISYRYHKLVTETVAKMTEGEGVVSQAFLQSATAQVDNRPLHTWVAPAESMRGVRETRFKVKWEDLFLDASSRWGLAMGVAGSTIKLAPLKEFFQNVEMANLGAVSDLEITLANDQIFSSFKIGDTAGENDALQGRFELNAPQEWAVQPTKAGGVRNMVSTFISGMYALENIRMTMQDQPTTEKKPDGRICILESGDVADQYGRYPLYRPQNNQGGIYATGLLDESAKRTAYNLTLTPCRNILRNKALFAVQFFFNRAGKRLKFLSAEREGTLVSNLGAGPVADRISDVIHGLPTGPLYDFSDPPFLPLLFKFRCAEPDGLYAALEANPNGYLKFWDTKTNAEYKGYIFELIHHPGNDGALECVLLAHPNTDLSTLSF